MPAAVANLATIGILDIFGGATAARKRLGGQTLLPWVVRRITEAESLDNVVVITREADRREIQSVLPLDVAIFSSCDPHPLARLIAAADKHDASAIVHVQIDSPFADPSLIEGLVQAAELNPETDHVAYGVSGDSSTITAAGMYAEWYKVASLKKLLSETNSHQESGWLSGIVSTSSPPHTFLSRYLKVPSRLEESGLRLRLDGPDAWAKAEEVIEALGPDEINWQRISGLVDPRANNR